MERKLNFDKMVYGDFCQRSHHNVGWDEDVENFEKGNLRGTKRNGRINFISF
ncbi:MAG: hypothetical protein ACLRUL_10485 [Clostridia bacterium]